MLNTSTKVTVLMPVYNGETYLRPAIDSILNQTYSDFEFLIINDCSTDKSEDIILSYKDPRIRLIKNEKNLGVTASLNKGLALSQGEFIARQDADDVSFPARLRKEMAALECNSSLGLVGTFFTAIDEQGEKLQEFYLPTRPLKIKQKLATRNFLAHGSVLFRKECIKKCGSYRMALKHCEDYDLWLRISEHFGLAVIPEFLYQWRINLASVSVNNGYLQAKATRLASKFHNERLTRGQDQIQRGELNIDIPLVKNLPPVLTRDDRDLIVQSHHYRAGYLLINDKRSAALEQLMASLKFHKFNLLTWVLFLAAITRPIIPRNLFRTLFIGAAKIKNAIDNI